MNKKTLLVLMGVYPLIGLAGGAVIGVGLYFLWPVIDLDATPSVRRTVLFAPPLIFAFLGLLESIQELIGYMKTAPQQRRD